jgi:UrcA family protein
MSRTDFQLRLISSTLVVIGLALSTGAMAQDSREGTAAAPEVSTVRDGRSIIGAPIDIITVRERVGHSDLNLSRTADATELNERIKAAAQSVCTALRRTVPFEDVNYVTCVRQAMQRARVRASIIVARK